MNPAQDLLPLIDESTIKIINEAGERLDKTVVMVDKDLLMQKLSMYLVEHDRELVERVRK